MENNLALPASLSSELKMLNVLLASLEVFSQNTKTFHWYAKGPLFFEIHEKYGEVYDTIASDCDVIAERIITLGGAPPYCFTEFVKLSKVKEEKALCYPKESIPCFLSCLSIILKLEREILEELRKTKDETTFQVLTTMMERQEKWAWQFGSIVK